MSKPARAVLLVLLAGCALTQRSAPLDIRYFAPPEASAPPALAGEPPALAGSSSAAPPLRLGRITPGALLRTRIVHRDSPVELVPYETLRWTDPPETYVRQALARALFDRGAFVHAFQAAPALDVDVLAFEEVRRGRRRFGRVALGYQLHDDTRVLAHGVVAIEREVGAGQTIDGVVAAIGDALDAAAAEVSRAARSRYSGP